MEASENTSNLVVDKTAPTEPPPPDPRDVEIRKLAVTLDEETLAALRKDSADLAVEICDQNEQLKRFTEETKASVKAKENKRRALTEKIESRSEVKNIECVWTKNFGNGRKELLRTDTGAIVDWRPLSHEDRQLAFVDVEADDTDDSNNDDSDVDDNDYAAPSSDTPFDVERPQ